MSVINQVLLNLERRRASPAERGLLPDHVQVLPENVTATHWGWLAVGAAIAVAAPAGWMALKSPIAEPLGALVARPGTEGVRAAAGRSERDEARAQELQALRLSLELSTPPIDAAPQSTEGGAEPLSTARVVGRMGAEPGIGMPSAAATASRSEASGRAAAAPARATEPEIRKQMRDPTPRDLSENEYRRAVGLLNQGRLAEAEAGFQSALNHFPENHQARQGLIGLLVQGRKLEEAERVLEEGVRLSPAQTGFSMTLARLQADRGDSARAITTLQQGLEHAQGSAEYAAFFAALLQRQGRHEEAIQYFQAALRVRPGTGVWWLGLGISLQAANQPAAAQNAYQQARAAGNLHPELAALAEQRLKQIQ
jgi:MSHA biogenesis protein MshN